MKNADIQIVGMKAAVEAQMEKKEFKVALATVNKAFELRQDLYWIIESAFELRAKAGDWEGAMQVLDAGYKKKSYRRPNIAVCGQWFCLNVPSSTANPEMR